MNLVGRASSFCWLDSDEIRFVFCMEAVDYYHSMWQ